MTEEEKTENEQADEAAPDDAPAEEPAAEDAPAEEAPAEQAEEPPAEEEAPAEEPPAEEPAAEEPAAEETAPAPAEDAEPEEVLSPKQLRKAARSQHTGEVRPQRAPEERAAERAAARKANAAARRRSRARARSKHEGPGQGTPPAERVKGAKKVRQGTVVSSKADKTITVRIEVVRRHPTYEKIVRQTATVHAHDEANDANEGDIVRVIESRPLSRTKRWRLVDVLERAR